MKTTKVCAKCKSRKKTTSFFSNSLTKDGLQSYCKKCNIANAKKHRQDNLERYQELEKQYRLENADKIAAYHQEYYSKPEVIEKTRKYHQKYKKKNKEHLKKYMSEWFEKNKEYVKEKALNYYYANKERILAQRKEKKKKK